MQAKPDRRDRLRAEIILLAARGWRNARISAQQRCGEDTVRR